MCEVLYMLHKYMDVKFWSYSKFVWFTAGKLDNETQTMMKKPRCGVKDKFEFEEDGQTSGRNTSAGIHSEDNDSASDCNCQGPG